MLARLLILFALLTGCATVQDKPIVSMVDGRLVMEFPNQPCPYGNAQGCYLGVPAIFYVDAWHREHELDHHRGMIHGAWVYDGRQHCAVVTFGGRSRWKTGEEICR